MGFARPARRTQAFAILCSESRKESSPGRGGFEWALGWFSLRRVVSASAVAIVVIGMAVATHHLGPQKALESEPDVVAKIDPQDYDVVADLDDLITSDDNNLWDDKPTL